MANLIYRCSRSQKQHPSWSYNAVLYEFNTRQFTPSGTFSQASLDLPRLAELGVDIIWMMPIFPIGVDRRKGTLGSYYSIRDYTAVNPEFGTMDDFVSFVSMAHGLGIKVILDWVANHTARDARWTVEHPEWYEWDKERGEIATPFDWDDTAKLDYSRLDMQQEMIRSMGYWIQEADVDGFRCDMAMLVPTDFWERATSQLTEQCAARGRELFMLAEAEGAEFHRSAFDATYAWEMHHVFNRIASGQANADTLRDRLMAEDRMFDGADFRMLFTSNHDENSWNGSEWERMGESAPAFSALTFVLSGMPLIYSGQESALGRRLEFFDRDPIEWDLLRTGEVARRINGQYRELCALKHDHPALRAGDKGGDVYGVENSEPWRVFSIKRTVEGRTVIALFNLSGSPVDVTFYDDDFVGQYSQIGSLEKATLYSGSNFYLPAWGYFIYYR